MHRIKCDQCGLANFASLDSCRKCGQNLHLIGNIRSQHGSSIPTPAKGFSYFPYVATLLIAGVVLFVVYGLYSSFRNVSDRDQQRIATQAQQEADAQRSRIEIDRERMADINRRMANLNLQDPKKQQEEMRRNLQPALDKMEKENERIRQAAIKSEEMKSRSLALPPR